ncbi:hypothetical protein Tco_0542483, partial [Tanacetum coccineum]
MTSASPYLGADTYFLNLQGNGNVQGDGKRQVVVLNKKQDAEAQV